MMAGMGIDMVLVYVGITVKEAEKLSVETERSKESFRGPGRTATTPWQKTPALHTSSLLLPVK